MIRRHWTRLLIAGLYGANIIAVVTGLYTSVLGVMIFIGTIFPVWVIWSLTKKPRRTTRMLAPWVTAGALALLGFYALKCFPFIGMKEYWCL